MPKSSRSFLSSLGFLAFCLVIPAIGAAQQKPFSDQTRISESPEADNIGFTAGSFIVAPIPFESPSLGTGLALGGAYLFRNDGKSDTSSITFGGFRSSNESQAVGLALNLAWDEDRWSMKFALADAALNYDLYVDGRPIPVGQSLKGARFELAFRPSGPMSYGGSLGLGEFKLLPAKRKALPQEFLADATLEITRVSAFGEYDTRDDTFYPTSGLRFSGTVSHGIFAGSGRSGYTKGVATASGYLPVFDQSVLAGHAVACRASDNAPFFDACSLGVTDNFRGYVSTEFLDTALVSVQTEFRGQLVGRLGYTVFAGAGSVSNDIGSALSGDFRAAGGVGLRIRLSKTFPLDYAIDLATNERGTQLLYISVGQRF